MDSGSEHSVHESVEDNEEFKKVSAVGKSGNVGESVVHDNGSCEVENDDKDNRTPSDVKGKGTEVSEPLPVGMMSEVSASHSSTKKGFGLKKWRRIKRDVSKANRGDSGYMAMQDLSESVANPSKRAQVYAERPQKSEGSVSSRNPLVESLDFFEALGGSSTSAGPSIDAGADSENSEDQSSKSSTAASIPKVKHDKSRIRSLSGKHLTPTLQPGQQGKVRIEAIKKAREDQVKIKEENSRSSMESDSCSSNFVFTLGTYASSNGRQGDRAVRYDGENDDEVKGGEQQVNDDAIEGGCRKDGEGGYERIPPEDGSADSYCKVTEEISENGSSSNRDPLVESVIVLQSAQEALEKEVLKFKEISSNASVDDLVSDAHPEVTFELKLQGTSSGQFPFGVGIERAKEFAETEFEDLFKQRIAAEVEYLTISRTIQDLRSANVNQTTNLEEQNTSSSEQNQMFKTNSGPDNKGSMLETEKEKLENFCDNLANAGEILKLQKRLCKYTSYFFIQLFCFLVILGVFISQLSPDYVDVVPT